MVTGSTSTSPAVHQTARAAHLPVELLLRIFEWLPEIHGDTVVEDMVAWTITSSCTWLRHCARVCKAWRAPAQNTLFRSVQFHQHEQCAQFVKTVMARPDLAGRTRALCVGLEPSDREKRQSQEEREEISGCMVEAINIEADGTDPLDWGANLWFANLLSPESFPALEALSISDQAAPPTFLRFLPTTTLRLVEYLRRSARPNSILTYFLSLLTTPPPASTTASSSSSSSPSLPAKLEDIVLVVDSEAYAATVQEGEEEKVRAAYGERGIALTVREEEGDIPRTRAATRARASRLSCLLKSGPGGDSAVV
ncbi:hypothetical protein JCM6882_009078 [Rhodosporidiobolus microsporus]